MDLHEIAAVGAAACWASTSILNARASAHLGAIAFTRIRMTIVFVMLGTWVAIAGSWKSIDADMIWPIMGSGIFGIFLGDSALFATMNRMGPRRTSILFATNAPMAAVLGWLVLGEKLSSQELTGILVVFLGVALAIVFGKRKSQLHHWESVKGPIWIGIGLGLAAGLAQAVGSLVVKPAMGTGADPIAVSAMRVGVAVVCFHAMLAVVPGKSMLARNPLTPTIFAITAASGFLAMAVGMTLVLYGLSGGEVGIISTLSSTSPALVLPLIWLHTGERPAAGAWIGAALVILGSWLIFSV